jgi:hypothetical protein
MIVHAKAPSGSGTLTACGKGSATDAIAEHGERVTCVACLAQQNLGEALAHLPDPAHHYDAGGIPSIDVLRAKLTPDQYEGLLLGNVIKYSMRYNYRGEKRKDAAKLADYACWLVEHLGEGD